MGAVAQCPKCGAGRTDGPACRKCGLSVDRWESFASTLEAVPDALGAAWEATLAQWSDPAAHEEVMRLVAQHDAFAWAANRYRTKAGDPIADKQLERIRKSAEITMMSSAFARPKDPAKNPYRATVAMLVTLVLLIAAGLVYAMFSRRGNEPPAYLPPTETR
jgi:hypothetical protein